MSMCSDRTQNHLCGSSHDNTSTKTNRQAYKVNNTSQAIRGKNRDRLDIKAEYTQDIFPNLFTLLLRGTR